MSFILISTIFFFIFFWSYIKIWGYLRNDIPTGSGIVFTFHILFIGFYLDISLIYISSTLFLIFLYYFDDLYSLNYLLRIFLQLCSAILIFTIYNFQNNIYFLVLIIILFVCLINVINFQDGNDLNLASIILLVFSVIYLSSQNDYIVDLSLIGISSILIFSIFNKKKFNIYLGDSGCYAFTILIFIITLFEHENLMLLKSVISILIFPIVDVFFVIAYRIYKKENLLTRNYYHIYQILFKKSKYYLYLIPNILISTMNFIIFLNLEFNIIWIINIILFNIIILSILRYILFKRKII